MADRYWVGGTGNWNNSNTSNWSATSGGASGASVPTASDNVFFNANSNTFSNPFTVTLVNSPRVCNDFTASGLDGTMTLAGTAIGLTVSGSLDWPATNFTRTYSGTTTFNATTTGKTVTTNGVSLGASTVIFDGVGGGWTLGSALNTSGTTLTVTNGTFDTSSVNNYSVTASAISSSNSNVRTINLNASIVTLSSNTTFWSMATSTNATLNAGTSTINGSGTSATFAGGGLTYYNVAFTSTALTTPSITGANTFNNLSISGRGGVSASIGVLSLSANQIINGTLTVIAGSASAYRIQISSDTLGTTRTLTCAAVSLTDVDFRDITIAGAASPASGTRLGDCKGNSGITFSAAKTVYFRQTGSVNWGISGSGCWSATSGGAFDATQFPLAQDTAVFPAATYPASGSTVTINANYNIGTIDMSLRTANTMTLATGTTTPTIYGDWINGIVITLQGTGTITFANRTTKAITGQNNGFPQPINISAVGGTIQIVTVVIFDGGLTLNYGTLDLAAFNGFLYVQSFNSSNTNTRAIVIDTTAITVSAFSATTVWNTAITTNMTTTSNAEYDVYIAPYISGFTVNTGNLPESDALSFFMMSGVSVSCTFLGNAGDTVKNVGIGEININAIGSCTIFGNLVTQSPATFTASTNAMTFGATSGTKTITTNAVTLDFPITFNGVGGTFQLQDALTMGSAKIATLTNGTLDLNGKTFTVGTRFLTGLGTKNLTFNGGTLICPSANATSFHNQQSTNFTTTAGTGVGTISMTSASAKGFVGLNSVFNCTLNQGGAGALTISSFFCTFNNITNTVQPASVLFTAGAVNTFINFNLSGTAGNLITIDSVTAGSHTLSKASGTVSADYLSISNSTATGGATWNAGANSTNGGNNSGWILPPVLRYWVGGAGTWDATSITHWSASSGGASGASVPTAADNVFFNSASNATAYAVTLGSNFVGTASFSTISSLTSTVTVTAVTSGSLAVGNLIVILSILFRITSLGTGTGGLGTYNCNVLRGYNGVGGTGVAAYSPAPICADISFSGPAVGTLTWVTTSSAIEVAGGATVAASGVTMSPILMYTGSSTHTITTNSVSMGSSYLAGTGTYTLGSAYTTGGSLYFCLGTFTTANFALTVFVFDQDSATTRTINLGSSTVTISSTSYPTGGSNPTSVFGANVTFNAGTSQVNFTGSSCFYFSFGLNKTWYNVSFTSTGINQQTTGGIKLGYGTADTPTFNNFSIAGQAVNTGVAQITLQTNMTINGTFTIGAASSVLKRIMLRTATVGTARTITAAAFAAGATDVDWQDITIAGAAGTISGTRFGDCGGCTNITFDAAKTVYWNLAGAQNWSATAWATSSGASPALNNFPLAQDTAVFDNTGSVTGTITIEGGSANQGWNIGTVDMSARTSAMTLAAGSTNSYPWIYGNWVNGSGTTVTNTGTIIFASRSIKTINSAGKAFPGAMTINAPGGGLQLLTNNLTTGTSGSAVTLTLTLGTMDFNNLSWTHYGNFTSNASGTRGLTFGTTGVFNFISGGGGDFNLSVFTGLTVSGTSSVSINPNGDNFCNVWLSSATEAQALNVNYTGTGTITHSSSTVTYKNLTFTGFTGTYAPTNIGFNIYGNLTLAAAMTLSSSTGIWNFVGTSGTKSITTAAKTLDFPIIFDGVSGTFQLQDALTMGSARTLTLTNGTLDLNGQTLTVGTTFTTATGTKNLTFNGGTLVCPTSGVTAFNNFVPTGFTTTAGTGTGYIQMTGATAKTFVGGVSTYNCVLQQAGAGTLTITGTNSFLDLQATVAGQPSSILFTAATTTTFTSFTLSGTAGNLVTIGSVTAASHTLSKASGTVSAGYLSISRSTATGGASWYAGANSTNGGNNSGWIFIAPPSATATGNFLMFF